MEQLFGDDSMLFLGKILASPFKGILAIFEKIHQAVEQEQADEATVITRELSDLYLLLESGKISDEEFTKREKALLDMLDKIEKRKSAHENNNNDSE